MIMFHNPHAQCNTNGTRINSWKNGSVIRGPDVDGYTLNNQMQRASKPNIPRQHT